MTMTAQAPKELWHKRIREEGGAVLFGAAQDRLQRQFFDQIPLPWLDEIAKRYGISAESPQQIRLLASGWIAQRLPVAELKSSVFPAIREHNPDTLALWSDESLLELVRTAGSALIQYAARREHAKRFADQPRYTPVDTSNTGDAVARILREHYGSAAINGLIDAKKLVLLDTPLDLPASIRAQFAPSRLGDIAGATMPDGAVYLVASQIRPEQVPGLFLHEVGEHAALADMLGEDYGRLCAQFDRLLTEGDTYATWAAMRVPRSTQSQHIPSERLAYLVERVANDEAPREGGEGGYALGNDCLQQLRTWLFRTPTCRWLDQIGVLETFSLTPADMAALAREAVNYHVQRETGMETGPANGWDDRLDSAKLDALMLIEPAQRSAQLNALPPAEALAYLYSLAALDAPAMIETINHWRGTLHDLAAGDDRNLATLAGAVLEEARRLEVRHTLRQQVDEHNFAMWMERADTPEQSDLYFASRSAKFEGHWQLTHYRADLGVVGDATYSSLDDVLACAHASAFPVTDREAPGLLQQYAQVRFHAVWHGSPHRFEQFNTDAIGTGEGQTAYGWGLYFAGDKDIASWYRAQLGRYIDSIEIDGESRPLDEVITEHLGAGFAKVLAKCRSNMSIDQFNDFVTDDLVPELRGALELPKEQWDRIKAAAGHLYEVELTPSLSDYLDWDKPLREQSEEVRQRLELVLAELPEPISADASGKTLYHALSTALGGEREASEHLRTHGIPGIRYLNGVSRYLDDESVQPDAINFVVFDARDTQISARLRTVEQSPALRVGAELLVENDPDLGTEERFLLSYIISEYRAGRRWSEAGFQSELENIARFMQEQGASQPQVQAHIIALRAVAADWLARGISENPVVMPTPDHILARQAFDAWHRGSVVVDDNGQPLVAYRGEHGKNNEDWLNTRHASYSFGDLETATLYATEPNDHHYDGSAGAQPRIIPVYLSIKKPLIDCRDGDPFIDMPVLIEALGAEKAQQIAIALEDYIYNTGPWQEHFREYESVEALIAQAPERLQELYLEAYPILDKPQFVEWLKEAGFDGAIYGSSGAAHGSTEYRVFSSSQVQSAIGKRDSLFANPKNVAEQLIENAALDNFLGKTCARNSDGSPKVLYHATNGDFTEFDVERSGGVAGSGVYMTDKAPSGDAYGVFVMPLYASIQNPADFTSGDAAISDMAETFGMPRLSELRSLPEMRKWSAELRLNLMAAGYDGALVRGDDGDTYYVAYSANQVKSAVGNVGSFDPNTADIRYKRGREAPAPRANGAEFGAFFHGTARPFESFDPERTGKLGGGYDHQGKAVYLTDDRKGLARFFAETAAFKVSLHDTSLSEEQADALSESGGVVLRVQLAPEAKILDLRVPWADREVVTLFEKSVGNREVGESLRQRVLDLGYDGIAFPEQNAPEGWEIKEDPMTIALYNESMANIVGHFPAVLPEAPVLDQDNPGGSWLAEHRQLNEEAGFASSGAPNRFGPITGSFNRQVLIPVEVLKTLGGLAGEQASVREDSLQSLVEYMAQHRRLPPQDGAPEAHSAPYIEVWQDGSAWVNEGNHRILAGDQVGACFLPVEIRYFAGGEQAEGILSPERVLEFDSQALAAGLTLTDYFAQGPARPALSRVDGDDFEALLGADGEPLVVYHGTTATVTEPGKYVSGDAQARAALMELAEQFGIRDWTSVAPIFERWERMGQADKFGVSPELVRATRRLYESTNGTHTPSIEKLAFDSFRMPEGNTELGVHLGDKAAAEMFGTAFPMHISLHRPIRLPDLGNWKPADIVREMRKAGVKVSSDESNQVMAAPAPNAAMRALLQAKGFDGVIYRNAAEGFADSYIVLDPAQIRQAAEPAPIIRFSFAGQNALTADLKSLAAAKARIVAGDDAEQVRQQTGWFAGVEGLWRFEIDDSKARLNLDAFRTQVDKTHVARLGDVLDHPTLYAAYPSLRDITVRTTYNSLGTVFIGEEIQFDGLYRSLVERQLTTDVFARERLADLQSMAGETADDKQRQHLEKQIGKLEAQLEAGKFNPNNPEAMLSSMTHEIQHAIQDYEHFPAGGNTEMKELPTNREMAAEINRRYAEKAEAIQASPDYQRMLKSALDALPPEAWVGRGGLRSEWTAMHRAESAIYEASGLDALEQERCATVDAFLSELTYQSLDNRFAAYRRLAGEVEARNVQARQHLSEEERRATPPGSTADIPATEQIILEPRKGEVWDALRALSKIETPEFKSWFRASKVVDKFGHPLAVYHGTNAGFSAFAPSRLGARDPGFFGTGFYFTPDREAATEYADTAVEDAGDGESTVLSTYVSLQNPFIWDMSHEGEGADATRAALAEFGILRDSTRGDHNALGSADERRAFNRAVRERGYDGVVVLDEDGIREVVAFRPEQIKSALDNSGSFDLANSDIRFSLVEGPKPSVIASFGEAAVKRFNEDAGDVPQVDTPEFKAWFRASAVVDADGLPMRVYHGTATDFEVFDPSAAPINDEGYMGVGSYFIAQARDASEYAYMASDAANHPESDEDLAVGARLLPVYLSIQNPYRLAVGDQGTLDMEREEVLAWTERLKTLGYDGVVNSAGNEWVAFEPTQIKSAIGNSGSFSPTNPDIRYSLVEPKAALRFVDEVTGAAYGQVDHTLAIYADGKLVGALDYAVYEGVPLVQMITVAPSERRQGYGRELVMELQRQHPGIPIDFGLLSDEGVHLYKSLPKIVVETEFKARIEELGRLQAERDFLLEAVERFNASEQPDAELQATRDRAFEVLNDLRDRIYDLESECDGEKAYATLIDTSKSNGMGQAQLSNDGTRFSFVGSSAQLPSVQRLTDAKARNALWIASGETDLANSPEQVRKETGWFTGADGHWRIELDDSEAHLKPAIKSLAKGGYPNRAEIKYLDYAQRADGTFDVTLVPVQPERLEDIVSLYGMPPRLLKELLPEGLYAAMRNEQGVESLLGDHESAKRITSSFPFHGINALPLGEVFDHPELYQAYPQLRTDAMVQVDPKLLNDAEAMTFADGRHLIRIGTGKQLSSLTHEVQHLVQRIEGFAPGGSVEKIRDQVLPELRAEVERLNDSITRAINQRSDLVRMVLPRLTAEDKAMLLGKPVLREYLAEMFDGQADDDFWEAAATNLPEYAAADELAGVERRLYLELKVLNNHISGLFKRSNELKGRVRQIEFDGSGGTYRKLAGEVEARNVQARMAMSAAERLELAPELTTDVAPADQLVLWRGQSIPSTAIVRSLVTGTLNAAAANDGTRFSFVGERAEGDFHTSLEQAKTQLATLQQAGRADAGELVRQETGWFVGVDGLWRFEIDDSGARMGRGWIELDREVNGQSVRKLYGSLGDHVHQLNPYAAAATGRTEVAVAGALHHPALMAAYPALVDVQVELYESTGFAAAVDGYYHPGKNLIYLEVNPELGGDTLSSLMHEVTHVIQRIEGFAKGGAPEDFKPRDGVGMSGERYLELRVEEMERKFEPVFQALVEDMDAGKISPVELAQLATQAADDMGLNDLRRRLREARNPFDAYQRLAGEVEARNVQSRLRMSADERRASPPASTADVPAGQQIVWGGQVMQGEQRLITKPAVRQTETAEFERWFGKSLVTNYDGSPQVMYHGSYRDFSEFDRMWSTRVRRVSMDTVGSWFSDNPDKRGAGMYASGEGGVMYPVYLSIARPKVYDTFRDFLRDMHEANGNRLEDMNPPGNGSPEALRERLKAQGYDGIAFLRSENWKLHEEVEMTRAAIQRATEEYRAAAEEMRANGMEMTRAEGMPYQAKIDRLKANLSRVSAELNMTGGSTEFDDQYVWIAFEPHQIKSAIGNNGDFSPTNPDIRYRMVDEPQGDVLAEAMAAERAELEAAKDKPLDMSRAARLQRAREMGFDVVTTWYHGSENAGFTSFNVNGGRTETKGTGAFFSERRGVARGYSGNDDDAPTHTGTELFNDPDLVDDLEIERIWAIVDAQDRPVRGSWSLRTTFPANSYDTPEQVLEDNDIELDPGESVVLRYNLYHNSSKQIEVGTEEECIAYLDNAEFSGPGIYAVYLRTKNVLEIDWEGRNWDNGPKETVWRIEDANGDFVDWVYSRVDADALLAANPGYEASQDEQPIYESTNDAARQARDMGYDAVLIKNVSDNGPHSHSGEDSTVMVVFDPSNIRSVDAAFDPEHSASSDIRLRTADTAVESPRVTPTRTEAFRNWFGSSVLVDGNGKPLVLYHGTHADFSAFSHFKQGTSSDAGWYGSGFYFSPAPQVAAGYAEGEGGVVMPVHVRIERPYYWRDHHERGLFQNSQVVSLNMTAELKAAGHDGVIVVNDFYSFAEGMSDESWALLIEASPLLANIGRDRLPALLGGKEYTYKALSDAYGKAFVDSLTPVRSAIAEVVAFDDTQIKSAISNIGTYDRENQDIRFRLTDDAFERQQGADEQVESPVFQRWFGKSQAVDAAGRPQGFYHGSDNRFTEFKTGKSYRQLMFKQFEVDTQGHFLSPSQEDAQSYGRHVEGYYLRAERPLVALGSIGVSSRDTESQARYMQAFDDLEYIGQSLIETDEEGNRFISLMGDIYIQVTDEKLEEGSWVYELADDGLHWAMFDNPEFVARMRERGYDSAKVWEPNDESGESWFVMESSQIKLARGNRGTFDLGNPDVRFSLVEHSMADRFDPADAGALIIGQTPLPKLHSVFHGSPHTFDQFKLERIGSGEGQQSFGWGLYFADLHGVASYYKGKEATHAKPHNLYEGTRLTRGRIDDLCSADPFERRSFFRDNQKALQRGENVLDLLRASVAQTEAQIERDKRQAARAERGESTPFPAVVYQGSVSTHQKKLQWLLSNFGQFEHVPGSVKKGGNLYQVELLADPQSYLHWDMPLAEQADSVRAALANLGIDGQYALIISGETGEVRQSFYNRDEAEKALKGHLKAGITATLTEGDFPHFRGREIYKALSAMHGGDRFASEALRNAGVPGLRFFDAPSRKKREGSCNYVLFDDSLAKTVARNGVPVLTPQDAAGNRISSISDVPGVALHGDFTTIQERLSKTVAGLVVRAEAHTSELKDRLQWLKGYKSVPRKLVTQTQSVLAEAKVREKTLQKWKAPTDNSVLDWDAPLSQRQRTRLAKLGDDFSGMTGSQVLQAMTRAKGSALGATAALASVGVTGIREGQRLVLWDAQTQQLSAELSKAQDLAKFHLAYHGSQHTFDEFRSDQIGTGEGAQAYGYGLYFTSGKMIARDYQTAHLHSMVWYENEVFSCLKDIREVVVPRLLTEHPELAQINYGELEWRLNSAVTISTHDNEYRAQHLEDTPEVFREVVRHLLDGIKKPERSHFESAFIMPAGGVRSLNAICDDPAKRNALSTIQSSLHWKVDPTMDQAQLQSALRETIRQVSNVAPWLEAHREIMEKLEHNPSDAYLLSRKRDCNWYISEAQEVADLLQDYPLEQWNVCKPIGHGTLYMVELNISHSEYLDHQSTFEQQSTLVQDTLTRLAQAPEVPEEIRQRLSVGILQNARGYELYAALSLRDPATPHMASTVEQEQVATALLMTEGVQGIRYPDGLMTGRSTGKANYVVFDEGRISIIGQTEKVIKSERDEIPAFDYCDIDALEEAQLQKRQHSLSGMNC